mmetsp:Transcript_3104/g.6545  ORF Transcript_3104/g.6545 Transcript_3104/m.6545 type:complete len:124 (-) Transcript_3104:7-378(-)
MIRHTAIEIGPTQFRITCSADNLRQTTTHEQHRTVKGATTQIKHQDKLVVILIDIIFHCRGRPDKLLLLLSNPIGQRGRFGLPQELDLVNARQFGRSLGGGPLRIVKIRRHSNHGPRDATTRV